MEIIYMHISFKIKYPNMRAVVERFKSKNNIIINNKKLLKRYFLEGPK